METPPIAKSKEPQIHDHTTVPLRWVFAICSVIITYAIYTAKSDVAGIRDEIRAMGANVASLNSSVSTLLADREYTKRDIEDLKSSVSDNRRAIWEVQKKNR